MAISLMVMVITMLHCAASFSFIIPWHFVSIAHDCQCKLILTKMSQLLKEYHDFMLLITKLWPTQLLKARAAIGRLTMVPRSRKS